MAQITQANRMIHVQGEDIKNQGGSPVAIVVVQVDYCTVSHAIGIVGVMYKDKSLTRQICPSAMSVPGPMGRI
jgi:hypothetical protein